jgi:curli biogenesis system outer membrane secretion channel CsgG
MLHKGWLAGALGALLLLGACASDPTPAEKVAAPYAPFSGARVPVTVGTFVNRSPTAKEAATPGESSHAAQARALLIKQLLESNRFAINDRESQPPSQEPRMLGREFRLRSAEYQIRGDIVDIGRREGEAKLFGAGDKPRLVYAAVQVYVVNTQNADPVYGARGFSEQEAEGPEAAQMSKVLELAVREAVKDIVEAKDKLRWGQEMR